MNTTRHNIGLVVTGLTLLAFDDKTNEKGRLTLGYTVKHTGGENPCGAETHITYDGLRRRIKYGKEDFCKSCASRGLYAHHAGQSTRTMGDREFDAYVKNRAAQDLATLEKAMKPVSKLKCWCDRAAVRFK